jgi:hypothetical protein
MRENINKLTEKKEHFRTESVKNRKTAEELNSITESGDFSKALLANDYLGKSLMYNELYHLTCVIEDELKSYKKKK